MSVRGALVLVAVVVSPALAFAQATVEPLPLRLPMGSRVRVQTTAPAGSWTKGILTSADSASVSMIPEHSPPLGDNQLRLPTASVSRLELVTGTKRHWLVGLAAGTALGLLLGATSEVDPVACEYDYNYDCSRGEALALYGVALGGIGAGVGALVKTDRWTPVALDALGPPAPRVSGVAPRLRALPSGGVELGLAIGF